MVLLISRNVLDELTTVYIVLRTSYQDEIRLDAHLSRLVVRLEVQAYGFQPRPSNGREASKEGFPSRGDDILWSGTIDTSEDAAEVVRKGESADLDGYILLLWRIQVPLSG